MVNGVMEEIVCARRTLDLSDTALRLLPDDEARTVFQLAEAHFVATPNRRWWWEDFRIPAVTRHFADGRGFEWLTWIVPSPAEVVWWIVEEARRPFFAVYEADVATIQQILGECYPFEYYLIPKDRRWLLCENHSDVLCAIGEEVQHKLKAVEAA